MISETHFLRRVLFPAILLVSAIPAQRTWVVDANAGAGSHYKDLPAAVAAASQGDILVVRAGTYSAFVTAKGLRLLGEPGAAIGKSGGLPSVGVSIHDLPAGSLFVISGITFANESMVPAMQLKDCFGSVVVDDIPRASGLFIVNCRRVSIRRAWLTGRPPILAIGADVLCQDVTVKGDPGFLIPNVSTLPASVGVQMVSARLVAVRSYFEGGGLWTQNTPALPTASAFDLTASTVRVIGSECRAGTVSGTVLPQPVVVGATSSFDLDMTTIMIPAGGARAVRGVTVTNSPTAALVAGTARLGSTVVVDFISLPGDLVWVLAGVSSVRVPVPGFGDLYLNLSSALVVAGGKQGALPLLRSKIALPNISSAKGVAMTWQAVRFSAAAGASLSNPADSVLH